MTDSPSAAPDAELLERFVRHESEPAFAAIVERHIALVHSVALRHTSNPEQAQDITQAVFIILARKAASLGRKTVLPGWLYHTARLTAANWQRAENRRIRREQEAYMQSTLDETAPDPVWHELSPLLDDAMSHLGVTDRDALVLRYFQNRSLAEVGTALGIEERAAQKRVVRALEKLRKRFTKRGVTLTATAIAGLVSANSVQAAPVGLMASVTAGAAKGATISATLTTLVKGTMKTMTWLKMKFAIGIAAAAVVAGGAATVVATRDMTSAQSVLEKMTVAYASLESYRSTGTVEVAKGGEQTHGTFSMELKRPDNYRVDYEYETPWFTNRAGVWSDASGHYFTNRISAPSTPDGGQASTGFKAPLDGQKGVQHMMEMAWDTSGGATLCVPSLFYHLPIPSRPGQDAGRAQDNARRFANLMNPDKWPQSKLTLLPSERVGKAGTDCLVLSVRTDGDEVRLWIGKEDCLVHQSSIIFSLLPPEETEATVSNYFNGSPGQLPPPSELDALKTKLNTAHRQAYETMKDVTVIVSNRTNVSGLKSITIHPPKANATIYTQTHENIVAVHKTDSAAVKLLKRVAEKYHAMESYRDDGLTFNGFITNSFIIKLGRADKGLADCYRIEWTALAQNPHAVDGAVWSAGNEHWRTFWNPDPRVVNSHPAAKEKVFDTTANFLAMGNMSGGSAWTIPPLFFGANTESGWGLLGQMVSFTLAGEEQVDGVACTVVAGHLRNYPDLPIRLWIGKDDLLIRKTERTTMESTTPMATDTPEMKQLLKDSIAAKTDAERAVINAKIQMKGALHSFATRQPMKHYELHRHIEVNPVFTAKDFADRDEPLPVAKHYPRAQWRNAGYATPEDAIVTWIWSIDKGDKETMLASLVPEKKPIWEKLLREQPMRPSPFDSFDIVGETNTSDGEISLTLFCTSPGGQETEDMPMKLQKIGAEWKVVEPPGQKRVSLQKK